jgi:hypothetical protein
MRLSPRLTSEDRITDLHRLVQPVQAVKERFFRPTSLLKFKTAKQIGLRRAYL